MSATLAIPTASREAHSPAADTATSPPLGFMQKSAPAYVILASFFVVTLPLCILALLDPNFITANRWPIAFYVCVLGTTHFVLTLTIYCQSANLRHFNSSWRNRIYYFIIPIAIFVLFDLYSSLQIAVLFPTFALLFRSGLRLLDFHHFTRQSFGVTQLFKARARAPFPSSNKLLENAFFTSLTVLLFLTFLNGGQYRVDHGPTLAMTAVCAALFVAVLAGFRKAYRQAENPSALWTPFTYFLLHATALGLVAYSTPLYVFALGMHYVEYHVLMIPRCFHTRLDPTSRTDRWFGRLRRNRIVFYGLVLAAAGAIYYLTWMSMGSMMAEADRAGTPAYLMLISLFDGLFVFHYFIEAFIWRFSDPFYRQTLGPLYFAPSKPKPAPAGATA